MAYFEKAYSPTYQSLILRKLKAMKCVGLACHLSPIDDDKISFRFPRPITSFLRERERERERIKCLISEMLSFIFF